MLDSTAYKTILHFEQSNHSIYSVIPFALFQKNIRNGIEHIYAGQTLNCPSGKENYRSKTPVRVGAWSIVNSSDIIIWDNLAQRFCYFRNGKPYKIIPCELKEKRETVLGILNRFILRNDTAFLPTITFDHYTGRNPILHNTPLFSLIDLKTGKIIKKLGKWDSIYTKIKFGNEYPDNNVFLQNVSYFVMGRKIFYLTNLSKTIHYVDIITGETHSLPVTKIEQDSLVNQVLIYNNSQILRQVEFRENSVNKKVVEIYKNDFDSRIQIDISTKNLGYLIACISEDEIWFSGGKNTKKTILYKTKLVPV